MLDVEYRRIMNEREIHVVFTSRFTWRHFIRLARWLNLGISFRWERIECANLTGRNKGLVMRSSRHLVYRASMRVLRRAIENRDSMIVYRDRLNFSEPLFIISDHYPDYLDSSFIHLSLPSLSLPSSFFIFSYHYH